MFTLFASSSKNKFASEPDESKLDVLHKLLSTIIMQGILLTLTPKKSWIPEVLLISTIFDRCASPATVRYCTYSSLLIQ